MKIESATITDYTMTYAEFMRKTNISAEYGFTLIILNNTNDKEVIIKVTEHDSATV